MQPVRKRRIIVSNVGAVSAFVALLGGLAWLGAATAAPDAHARAGSAPPRGPDAIRFGRDIRPILSDRCFGCHGPDERARQADLRLDVRESALTERDGRPAIFPGRPERSELWLRVSSDDPQVLMPPPGSNKRPLSDEERELVRRWIAAGAEYEPHWAFVPPVRPALPEVRDPNWCRNPVDRFVLHRLEQAGTTPSAEADRETLIRRVFLDLTGLPPTPEEIDAFLADERPDAYERWVDKLLTAEPYRTRYAERMAAPWLDASRYADTCGIHTDAGRQMWLWRDWVLEAFRDNIPFDRFVIEQLAGDLLPDATDQQRIASGFNRNHVTTDEGGAIAEEYLVEYAVDRANTTGSVFLGLTLGCARCHEHKYDPIPQEDYYRFYAFFDSIEEPGLYAQRPDPNRALEPFIVVPTPEQTAERAELAEAIKRLRAELEARAPDEDEKRNAFIAGLHEQMALCWEAWTVTAAESAHGATLTPQDDGSVLASGENPGKDEHLITLRTDATDLRLLLLEAFPDASLPDGRVGRAPNGNAVLTRVEVEAASVAEPARVEPVRLVWAFADVEQDNGDFRVVNVLDASDDRGWAVHGHGPKGGRVALLLAEEPFGFEGGTELRVRLRYNSVYAQHVLGRVRLRVGRLAERALDRLPAAVSGWYMVGPFPAKTLPKAYQTRFGPEQDAELDLTRNFGAGNQYWRFRPEYRDGQPNGLVNGRNAVYVGRRVFCPTARKVDVSLGSDDGFALFVNGEQVAARDVKRAVEPDQDKAAVELRAGANTIVMKIINAGGPGGFYYRADPRAEELAGDLVAALLPEAARPGELEQRLSRAWRMAYSPGHRERVKKLDQLEKRKAAVEKAAPRTMVMKELPEPRPTFVLTRGQYDKPDKSRPVTRGVPAALGKLPDDAPTNRLGLARWLTAAEDPLLARVTVNRFWQMLFGTGLVATSEDFGLQGEWPSHPELLDWLAVEFRECGWDVHHILRLIVTSSTYRQGSRVRTDLLERDPNNRLLAYFPRRRLGAEQVRDQALYVSGLLVEKLGGPSVKPYQPAGLWKEVAMVQSNTRIFERGQGPDLWRRSLYTFWKRACPPPSLMAFDAPTRESCTIRRSSTNTPLQALVLWNDDQYVEAARVLAERVLNDADDDGDRLVQMFRRCTGRRPDGEELHLVRDALMAFRDRYRESPDEAGELLKVGEAPVAAGVEAPELAAWTMIANGMLNLSATITQR